MNKYLCSPGDAQAVLHDHNIVTMSFTFDQACEFLQRIKESRLEFCEGFQTGKPVEWSSVHELPILLYFAVLAPNESKTGESIDLLLTFKLCPETMDDFLEFLE